MNKTLRHGIFFVSIFLVMFVGSYLLGWTTLQSVQILGLLAIVMKLTDIEQTIEEKK